MDKIIIPTTNEIVQLIAGTRKKHPRWLKKLMKGNNSLFVNVLAEIRKHFFENKNIPHIKLPTLIIGTKEKGRVFVGGMFTFFLPKENIMLLFSEKDFAGDELKIGADITGDYILICYDKGAVKKANEN